MIMTELEEQPRLIARERVIAFLDTLRQPEVIVDLAVGGLITGGALLVGEPSAADFLLGFIAANAVGPIRGELQKGYYGGNNPDGTLKEGGEWWYEGDHTTLIQRFISAIKTGKTE